MGHSLLVALLAAIPTLSTVNLCALPKRLIVALDGVSYRDMKALQEGVLYHDGRGRQVQRQAFHEGYFPVSRMISTFPSASDVAWTDILGDRPLPGYQRTYFSTAANSQLSVNSLTSSMEYESQMDCEVGSGFLRALGYVVPRNMFKYELRELVNSFLKSTDKTGNYFAYFRSTDDAQHLSGDIYAMLCALDEKLKLVRARYRAREGRELEILLISDHGNNHAGAGQRVEVRAFLKKAGYRFTQSITSPKDIVLPTSGIESWVEIHNYPAETERLLQILWHLKGVDLLTARSPDQPNRFAVVNAKGERAAIDWNPAKNRFRYSPATGDPLNYQSVVQALADQNQFDAAGFASADAWMTETLTHRYPLALERIARAHTRITRNPATILISLSNDFVHADWLIKKSSELVKSGGTHGGLDDLNSNGILLSSFAPTTDTSTSRVAALFDGFPGRRDYRAATTGADWIRAEPEALPPTPQDGDGQTSSRNHLYLRIWTPGFSCFRRETHIEVKVAEVLNFPPMRIRRSDPIEADPSEQRLTLNASISTPAACSNERLYALPPELALQPRKLYRMSGRICTGEKQTGNFKLFFRADSRALPIPD